MVRTFDLTDADEAPEIDTGPQPPGATDGRPQGRKRGAPQKRARPKNALDGWIVLDKPAGLTSTQALGAVKRLFLPEKAGHAGTLDPLATGLLPLALGEATKTVPYVVNGWKSYRFTVRWGVQTDTDDADGAVIASSDVRPDAAAVAGALAAFTGDISQVPPCYSAVKVNGERAYDLARDGETVELKSRVVTITRLEVVAQPSVDETVLEADCGKGTYVRAIARDLGLALGTCAHVTALRRTRVGPFGEVDMVTLEALRTLAEDPQAAIDRVLRPPSDALIGMPTSAVDRNAAGRLRRGQSVLIRPGDPLLDGETCAFDGRDVVALCSAQAGELRPVRVFRTPRRRITVPIGRDGEGPAAPAA